MKIKEKYTGKTIYIVVSEKGSTSKNITVYDADRDEIVKLITEMINNHDSKS